MDFIPTAQERLSGRKKRFVIRFIVLCLTAIFAAGIFSAYLKHYNLLAFQGLGFLILLACILLAQRNHLELPVLLAGLFCYSWLNYLPFITGYLSGAYLNFLVIYLVVSYVLEKRSLKTLHRAASILALVSYFYIVSMEANKALAPPIYLDIFSIITGYSLISFVWFYTQKDIKLQNHYLSETRSFLKVLVDKNPLAIITKDKKKRITFANQTALDIYQDDSEEVFGKRNEELQMTIISGSDYDLPTEEDVLRGNTIKDVLELHPNTPRGERWFKSMKKPLRDASGEIYGMMIFAEDITTQKKTEEALLESEFRYRNLIENNQFGMATDKNGTLTSVNEALCEMTQYKRSELLGRNVYEIVEVLDPEKAQKEATLLQNGEIPFIELSCRYHRKDGTVGYGLVRKSLITNSKGEVVEQLATIADISVLKEKENALRLSQEKYLSLFEAMPIGLLLLDTRKDLFPIEVNPKWAEMIGCHSQEKVPRDILDFSPEIQPDGQASADKLHKILEGYHKKSTVVGFEWHFLDNAKNPLPTYCILQPISSGESWQTMMIVRDISEEKRQANTIIRQMNDLNEKNRQLSQFGYVVSHNFRSSVANIMGLQEILRHEVQKDNPSNAPIAMMGKVVTRLDEAIKDLNLIFSIQNTSNRDFSPVELSQVFEEVESLLASEIEASHAVISYQISAPIHVLGIKSYFTGIFQNLLSNSIKYRHPDKFPLIKVSVEEAEKELTIRFEDNGRGIDLKKHEKDIFNLYKRFHDDVEGKGMGLYLVKVQTEIMRGKIFLESQTGYGTTFTLKFPILKAPFQVQAN